MSRSGKSVLFGVGAFLAITASLLVASSWPTEAAANLPGTTAQVAIQLRPTHPYLSEYNRTVVLRNQNHNEIAQDLFPDTGGYARSQLYLLGDGEFILRGYYDVAKISVAENRISTEEISFPHDATYLGAFDHDASHNWRFLPAAERPEQTLVASGD